MTYEIISLADRLKANLQKAFDSEATILTQRDSVITVKNPLTLIRQLQEQALKGYCYVSFYRDERHEHIIHALYRVDRTETREIYI